MSDQSKDDDDKSIREIVKRKFCAHDWRHYWAKREKVCRGCGVTQSIEKEYTHEDESAEIGDTRLIVDDSGKQYRVDRERYTKTGHGPDDAYFQWFPSGGFYADESDLLELQKQIDRVVDTDTNHSGRER